MKRHRLVIFILTACFGLTLKAHAQEPAVYSTADDKDQAYSCAYEISRAEAYYQIPRGLLYSVGIVESGRFGFPWPWTLNIDGQGYYADSYANAASQLYDNKGKVKTNMAVGCMQIHMRYHAKQFETPGQALDPANNVWYAAAFLRDLYQSNGNWTTAVARYHADNPQAQQKYVCRVLGIYRQINELPPSTDPYCRTGSVG